MNGHQRVWTTTVLSESDQFPFWREVVWEAFVPVTLSRADEAGFTGSVGASRVGPLGVAAIASEAQVVERTAADVRRHAGDVFFLNMPLRGGSTVTQDGRVARLGPGDFAVVDGTRPFELDFEGAFEQLSLIIPHELLMPLLAIPETITARTVRTDAGLGAVAGGALRPLFGGWGGGGTAAERPLADRLASLVALALGAGAAASGSRAALTQAALDEIERSLGDPELSPMVVAARVGISTRYLHKLFAARGSSFGRHLLARRLERCRTDLADPGLADWTIGEIGWRNGFADPSYLARAFRRAYGISPGEHRRATAVPAHSQAVSA
ncbi:MAG TPA: helix-turn-helix domain-containing protein [Solirubrobacterales bacterium]|nr:helix-turn-helix domain-containing protein [Solirubrobacterales bacterium]